jgi:hypothetical protein
MMVDSLTKALQNNNFLHFMEYMNLRDICYLLAQRKEIDLQKLDLEELIPNKG